MDISIPEIHTLLVQRLKSIAELKALKQPVHLALGVFDGVHLGHQAVIDRAVEAAKRNGGLSGVFTFDPYPIRVLAPQQAPKRLLASLDHKLDILKPMGVDFMLAMPFDKQQAKVEAGEFIRRLVEAGAVTICAGEDWRFGHQRSGDRLVLNELSKSLGFRFEAVAPVILDGERISSTRIRQAVRDGNLDAVEQMLGRPYTVTGTVIEGRKVGRQLGFPTANLERGEEQYPPDGVWAVYARIGEEQFEGAANLGVRPTVDSESRLLEVHFFDLDKDLYGQRVEVEFVEFLRPQSKFESLETLKDQIDQDCEQARSIFLARRSKG